MAERKPKQIYQSGELDKTRKNLGALDPEEARRMASLLGGEIGREKDSEAVRQGYDRLTGHNRRRSDTSRRSSGKRSEGEGAGGSEGKGAITSSSDGGTDKTETSRPGRSSRPPLVIDSSKNRNRTRKSRKNYWVRIRTNFLAARREHNIKTFASALSSVFSFIPTRDGINPRFIREAQKNIYEPITAIQKSSAALLKAGTARSTKYRPDPFYKTILEILAAWDTKTMGKELTKLEKLSGNLTTESLTRFCRALFIPVIRLQNLDPDQHVSRSIRHFYELHLKICGVSETSARLKAKSLETMALYPLIHKRIHHGCYPLLMALSSPSFSEYEEYYISCKPEYLSFLLLDEENIILPPELLPPVSPEENNQVETEWEPPKEEEKPIPPEFTEGLRFLQEMFPQAGFDDMAGFPDFCPYFLPLFDLPRNFELLPPEDPMQGITVIMCFLKELFFAFGNLEFTAIHTEEWTLTDIRTSFEEYTAGWYSYLENFIPKLLLTPLQEYCRGVEKAPDFGSSSYGSKLASKIFWLKRSYCLPHMEVVKKVHGKSPVTGKITRLYHLTEDLYSLFSAILNNGTLDPGVKNLDVPIHFEVPTEVSERFIMILKRRGMEGSNRDLLRVTASLLCLLNELLTKPSSFYYKFYPHPIYRSEKGNTSMPLYTVAPLDSILIIKDWDERMKTGGAKGACSDETSGETRECSRDELVTAVTELIENEKRLREGGETGASPDAVLVRLKISSPVDQNPMEPVLQNTLRLGPDQWYRLSDQEWMISLSETPAEGAVRLTTRLLNQLVPLYDPSIILYASLIPLLPEWDAEKALYLSDNCQKEAEKRRGEVVVLYNPGEKKYRLYTIKSRKKESHEE